MIQIERVEKLLRPWLGRALLDCTNVCEQAAELLEDFDVMHDDYADLATDIKMLLQFIVGEMSGGDMTVYRDNGRKVFIREEDFDIMADALLYLRFQTLVHSAFNCTRIREFALSNNSLSALRALYVDFSEFQTAEEKALLAHTARTCHPAFRYRSWLGTEDNHVQ